MSNVVTSQPRLEAKIDNSKEPPPSEINCEKCREDDDQCCFVYFYSLYCSQCRCSGCCDDEKQKRRRTLRRRVNNYYTNDTVFNDDLYVTRGFINDENDFVHTHNDYEPSEVTNEYYKATNNLVGHAVIEGHSRYNNGVGGDLEEVCASGATGYHSADGYSPRGPEGASHSHVDKGGGDHTVSEGVCPSGTASGGYSGGYSESGGHPSGNEWGEKHCVSEGHSEGETSVTLAGRGDDSGGHCVSVDDSGGNSGGGDTGGDCGGDTGGDSGGGDTGGDGGGGGDD